MTKPIPSDERVVGAMIRLARVARPRRMIEAGPHSSEVLPDLHRCDYTCNAILPLIRTDSTNTVE
jgi:hypothetical protein